MSPVDIGHIVRLFAGVNLSAIAVILENTWAFCVSFDRATHNNKGYFDVRFACTVCENHTIFICWLYQFKTLLPLVQIIVILWLKCWNYFTLVETKTSHYY